jgi:hypothetical protein
MRCAWLICGLTLAALARAGDPAPRVLTAEQDHKLMLEQLGITQIRPGANGRDPSAANAANYDESKANPFPLLPDPLVLTNGKPVLTARDWTRRRRPELVELFDREIYGRTPRRTPSVSWEVKSTSPDTVGGIPVVVRKLIGHVDNRSYPEISVDIDLTLTTPAGAKRRPVIMEFFPVEWAARMPPQPSPTWQEQGPKDLVEKAKAVWPEIEKAKADIMSGALKVAFKTEL